MKTIKYLFITALIVSSFIANAQTLDDIIAKHTLAMGGKEKLESLKTVRMTGSMTVQGNEVSLSLTKKHLAGVRLDLELMGTSNYQFANAEQGWKFMPVMGMSSPQEMEAEEFKSFSTQSDIHGGLINYSQKNNLVEMTGKEAINGVEAYKLKLTYPNKKTSIYYIDSKTGYLIKSSTKTMVQGQEMEVETSFADYKQNADGYWFPYSITNMQGTIVLTKIETNVKVDESIFRN